MKSFSIGHSSIELQNCLTEAEDVVARRNGAATELIDALVADGRHVVVESTPYHCKATDALAGYCISVLSHHESREVALAYCDGYAPHVDDCRLEIFPLVKVAPAPMALDNSPF